MFSEGAFGFKDWEGEKNTISKTGQAKEPEISQPLLCTLIII